MNNIVPGYESKLAERSGLHHWLLISCLFSLSLLTIKIVASGHLSYGFLAWNLFLAFVPYSISSWLSNHTEILKRRIKLIPLVVAWVLFMPNSFYILTDLFHLNNIENDHPWFDLLLLFSFAWNGILFGILSVRKMESLLKKGKRKFVSVLVISSVMWLNAVGVYIGRVLRFNSWDIFVNPFSLISETGSLILNPFDYRHVWAMNSFFTFFMIIAYYTVKSLGETFKYG